MQICSNVLNSKISKPEKEKIQLIKYPGKKELKYFKPAMSRIPMKFAFFMVGSMRVLLQRSTSQANILL